MRFFDVAKLGALLLPVAMMGCAGTGRVAHLSQDSARLKVECLTDEAVPNASYVGPYYDDESHLSPTAIAQDVYCANQFRVEKFKNGFIAVFGDPHIGEVNRDSHYAWINELNNELYVQLMAFAQRWSSKYGQADGYPILTGGGSGLMEAAARGAMQGSGVSIGFGSYRDGLPTMAESGKTTNGNPATVFARYPVKGVPQPVISDGLIFSSAVVRDDAMLSHAAAIIIAPGGFRAHGVLFRLLELRRDRQLAHVPIYLVGDRKFYWAGWNEMKDKMLLAGTVTQKDFDALNIEFVENPGRVIDKLEAQLRLRGR